MKQEHELTAKKPPSWEHASAGLCSSVDGHNRDRIIVQSVNFGPRSGLGETTLPESLQEVYSSPVP